MLNNYEDVVKSVAYEKYVNSNWQHEDIEQELRLKVIELTKQNYLNNKTESDARGYVRKSLRNHMSTIIYNQSLQPDTSDFRASCVTEIDDEDDSQSHYIPSYHYNFHQNINGSELIELIEHWLTTQDSDTNLFIKSIFDPDQPLKEFWDNHIAKCPRLSSNEFIPPFTICKFYKINKSKVYKIWEDLELFLDDHGYNRKEISDVLGKRTLQ